jgi:hypothetical protein
MGFWEAEPRAGVLYSFSGLRFDPVPAPDYSKI